MYSLWLNWAAPPFYFFTFGVNFMNKPPVHVVKVGGPRKPAEQQGTTTVGPKAGR
jgi:hypothetical protein